MAVDLSALAKWPDVPACYDWLSLDRRGDWRLQGERITHGGLIAFINRQYNCDESGCWFVQNGPQRVFVSLACTPWIFRHDAGNFISHTGVPPGALRAIHLDEGGNVLLETALGIGLLDDRDLAGFAAQCRDAMGRPVEETAFLALMGGNPGDIRWESMAIKSIAAVDVPGRFSFQPMPKAT